MDETRNELEVGNETMVMMYLNILKYAKHHCSNDEDPYEITDRVFTDALVANNKNNQKTRGSVSVYQINLGLQPNPRATARKVDKFLTTDFQRYLNLAGLHRNQLTSPQLSFAPGSTNKNGVEDNFIDEALDDIKIADPARKVCAAIYKTMDNCTDTAFKPYRRILIGTYIDQLRIVDVAATVNLSTRSIDNKKINAQCEFADRWLYWKKYFDVEGLPDLRVFTERIKTVW